MTQREGRASTGVSEATPRPTQIPALPENGACAGSWPRAPLWEDIYLSASSSDRARLLSLADTQGLLHGHQLPSSTAVCSNSDPRQFVARILKRDARQLEPVRPNSISDDQLTDGQREAIAKALATPDICLIQGLPVTGKSRVAAEIVQRATARGERVLLAAPCAASLDRTLELVQKADGLCAIRCLGREEQVDKLPPWSRALLLQERVRSLHEEAMAAAAQWRNECSLRVAALIQDAAIWPHLLELAERHEQLTEQGSALARQRDEIPTTVEAAVARILVGLDRDETASTSSGTDPQLEAPLRAAMWSLAQTGSRIDEASKGVSQQIDQEKSRLSVRCAEQDAMAALAEAKAARRWWTRAWWRALFQGDVAAKAGEIAARVHDAREKLAALESEASRLAAERRQAEEQARLDRLAVIAGEVARRTGELDDRGAALDGERRLLEQKWADALAQLSGEAAQPNAPTVQAVRESRAAWQRAVEQAEAARAFSEGWAAMLANQRHELADKLRQCANVVAAIAHDLPSDEHFGADTATFDLLVLEHAEQVTEAELMVLVPRARRLVLLAESELIARVRDMPLSRPSTDRDAGRSKWESRRAKPCEPCVFQRLWNALHCDPGRLPYIWLREADERLCCRLRPVAPEQRRWIETERVADHPEIELRIVAPPRNQAASAADSFLAEVVFPAHTPLVDAKAYIFRELEEVPVRASARAVRWSERADRLVLHLTDDHQSADVISSLELAPGVRELLATRADGDGVPDDGWVTRALEFERAAGWERKRAEEWIQRYLGLADLGRTTLLDTPIGISAGIALVLSDLLFEGGYRLNGTVSPAPAVEFVAVPPLPGGHRRNEQRRSRLPSGAGFEADPADVRSRDRLPAEHRAALNGGGGIVNYPEAQAIVRYLSLFVAQVHAQPGEHQSRPYNGAQDGPQHSPRCSVAVIALYPAQAKLICQLLERTPEILASSCVKLCVDVPSAFGEREFSQVLVSLTRSHTHRAISFGEGPAALTGALTRGRDKLVLFGDVGTLARRAEWQGVVDHLSESASARENAIIGRLLRYIQGQNPHPQVFQVKAETLPIAVGNRGHAAKGQAAREGSNA